jgi:hypothetical protein
MLELGRELGIELGKAVGLAVGFIGIIAAQHLYSNLNSFILFVAPFHPTRPIPFPQLIECLSKYVVEFPGSLYPVFFEIHREVEYIPSYVEQE